MNKEEALLKYSKRLVSQYRDADRYVIVNDDPDLIPIRIPLPECPDWDKIDGFGLKPDEQFFQRVKIPKSLKTLEKKFSTIEELWEEIDNNQTKYQSEIDFIRKQWWHFFNGYWCFIHGVPTYFPGSYWFYLNYWHLDVGLPKYKAKHRWLFTANEFLKNNTLDFKNKDKDGFAETNQYGEYEMVDTGRKLHYGIIYFTMRRDGKSYMSGCDTYHDIITIKEGEAGIQARNDDDAFEVFYKKVTSPFKKMAFWFRPKYNGTTDPKTEIMFDSPVQRTRGGTILNMSSGNQSKITYEVSSEGAYDGRKLYRYICDEVAKVKPGIDILERHNTVRWCMSEDAGKTIVGWAWYISTVGEMTKGGGDAAKKLVELSNYYQRSDTGMTSSGLVFVYISSLDGIECDKWGNPDREAAQKWLDADRRVKLAQKDYTGWAKSIRDHPATYQELWTSPPVENGINIYIINKRLQQIYRNTDLYYRKGYFDWVDGFGTNVKWVDSYEKSCKFHITFVMPEKFANNRYKQGDCWFPNNIDKFIASADPYRYSKTSTGKMSLGAGAVFYLRDYSIDYEGIDTKNMSTNRFVCDYIWRPDTKYEYAEDMLKMCIYFGCLMYPENNIDLIEEYFKENGFGGYLKYDLDPSGRKLKLKAGFYSNTEQIKQSIFDSMRNYIQLHGMRERHPRILLQCKDIRSIDDLTHFDLFAAAGGTQLALNTSFKEHDKKKQKEYNIGEYIETRHY